MKKIVSTLITAALSAAMCLSMAAMAVSADEIQTETKTGFADESNKWTVTEKYFAASYTMKLDENLGQPGDNGCCGIVLGGSDGYACLFIPYDTVDGAPKCNKQVKFGPWWSNSNGGAFQKNFDIADDAMGKDATIIVLGSQEDGKLTVDSLYLNGEKLAFDSCTIDNFNGSVGYATKLTGVEATAKFLQSAEALDATCFDEKTSEEPETPEVPENPDTPEEPEEPEAPKTGSAVIALSVLGVVALGGVVIASKKREHD
ncbi:MAG: NPXTG-anchored protein [Eubacteriales bacterium]